jgi:hypothetical protein
MRTWQSQVAICLTDEHGRLQRLQAIGRRVRELQAVGLGATVIASKLGIGPASVYRVMDNGQGRRA